MTIPAAYNWATGKKPQNAISPDAKLPSSGNSGLLGGKPLGK
jgi:hypothetical protein